MRVAWLALGFAIGCAAAVVAGMVIDNSLHPSFRRVSAWLTADEFRQVAFGVGWLGLMFVLGLAGATCSVRRMPLQRLYWTILAGMVCGLGGGFSLRATDGAVLLGVVWPLLVGLIVGLVSSSGSRRVIRR